MNQERPSRWKLEYCCDQILTYRPEFKELRVHVDVHDVSMHSHYSNSHVEWLVDMLEPIVRKLDDILLYVDLHAYERRYVPPGVGGSQPHIVARLQEEAQKMNKNITVKGWKKRNEGSAT